VIWWFRMMRGWANCSRRTAELERRLEELERANGNLAANLATLWKQVNSTDLIASKINAHLALHRAFNRATRYSREED
jgi:hypothetical protein